MAATNLERRVRALEGEVAKLKQRLTAAPHAQLPWWERVYGAFENDPAYDEAMRLGREYRESLRPGREKAKPKKRLAKGNNGHSRHRSR
jgi:hypothetical protein